MKRSKQEGFTLIELMITVAIVGVVAAMTAAFYRQGLLTESEQSKITRNLVNSLHLARVRALNNLAVVPITNGTYDAPNTMVVFTSANHGLSTGDYVTFTLLDVHAAMNGATYFVTKLDADRFQCLHYTTASGNDTTGSARCINRASKLVIWKRSAFKAAYATQADQLKQLENDENFVYDDTRFLAWLAADETATKAANSFTVSFNSRGYASVNTGYQVIISAKPLKPGSYKMVTVVPSGRVQPGS